MLAYRETFRRHRVLYLLPALIAAIAVGALSYKAPTYVSSASLWVDNQASSTSSLNVTPQGNQASTPSGAEQTTLNELLATTKFQAAVIAGAGLGHPDANSPLLGLVSGVSSSTPGPQVLRVTCIGPSPKVAHDIVKSVITQLQNFSQQWAQDFARSSVSYYQAQVASATTALNQAKAASGTSQAAALQSARQTLESATTALNQAQAQAKSNTGFATVLVLGQPTFNSAPMRGLKKLLLTALGAGAAVLMLSLLVIVIRTPGGHDEWDAEITDARPAAPGGASLRVATAAAGPGSVPTEGATVHDARWTHGPVNRAADGGARFVPPPVAAPAPVTPAAPVTPPAPAGPSGAHALRRTGLLARKTVMPQASDDGSQQSPAAEGGRA
jgi:hypothetical protein